MFLLSDEHVLRQLDQGGIRISPFKTESLMSTCYYFTLGQHISIRRTSGVEPADLGAGDATLDPAEIAIVKSNESFDLDENTLAILGPTTTMGMKRRLLLMHGPSVDPSYRGPLDLAILNVGESAAQLRYGMTIGKMHFFNIADSSLPKDHKIVTLQSRLDRMASEARILGS